MNSEGFLGQQHFGMHWKQTFCRCKVLNFHFFISFLQQNMNYIHILTLNFAFVNSVCEFYSYFLVFLYLQCEKRFARYTICKSKKGKNSFKNNAHKVCISCFIVRKPSSNAIRRHLIITLYNANFKPISKKNQIFLKFPIFWREYKQKDGFCRVFGIQKTPRKGGVLVYPLGLEPKLDGVGGRNVIQLHYEYVF